MSDSGSANQHPTNKSRPGRVHFASFLRASVPPDTPTASLRSLSPRSDSEHAPLLNDPEEGIDDEGDEDETRYACTARGSIVTILVLLAIAGVCAAAVFLRVGSRGFSDFNIHQINAYIPLQTTLLNLVILGIPLRDPILRMNQGIRRI